MTAKNAQEQTNEAKKLNIVQDHERWIEEMNRSFRILKCDTTSKCISQRNTTEGKTMFFGNKVAI